MYAVQVSDQRKGEVFRVRSRWAWARPNNGGVEVYCRGARLLTMREHIARVTRTKLSDVRLVKIKD
jgi:hypothetical protein